MANFKTINNKQYIYVDTFNTNSEALSEKRRNKDFDTKIEKLNNGFVLWRSVNRKSSSIRIMANKIVSNFN